MARVRWLLIALGKGALALIVVVLTATMVLLLAARSDRGKAKLLAWALPRIQSSLDGKLGVARIEGDLFHNLVLHDLALDDAEGQPAIRARRVEARYRPASLLFGEPRIEELRVEGGWVRLRQLDDGRLNLATIAAPAPTASAPRLRIDRAIVDATLRYETPPSVTSLPLVEAAVHVETGIAIGERITLDVGRLEVNVAQPVPARVSARGQLSFVDGSPRFRDAVGEAALADTSARHFVPLAIAPGVWTLDAKVDGPVSELSVALHAALPAGALQIDGTVGFGGGDVTWRGSALTDGVSLISSGHLNPSGVGALDTTIDLADLSRLAAFGLPAIDGSGRISGTLSRTDRALRIEADAGGSKLALPSLPSLRIGRLQAHLASLDDNATGRVQASGVRAGGFTIPRIEIDAHGDTKSITAQGALHLSDGQIWRTTQPARVAIGNRVRVGGLRLASAAQRLAVDGSYRIEGGRFQGVARGEHLDAASLGAIFAPGHRWPKSDLTLDLRARGTPSAPIVDAEVVSHPVAAGPDGGLLLTGGGDAHYAGQRVRGSLRAEVAGETRGFAGKGSGTARFEGTLDDPRLTAEVRLLTDGDSPLRGTAEATVVYRDRRLDATLAGRRTPKEGGGRLDGTLHAKIDLPAVLRAPARIGAHLAVAEWQARLVGVELAGPGFDRAGIVVTAEGDGRKARFDGSLAVRRAPLLTLHGSAASDGEPFAAWREIALTADGKVMPFPLALLPALADRLSGKVDGSFALRGTLGHPTGSGALHLIGLRTGEIALGDFVAALTLDGAAATARLDSVAGTPGGGTLHASASLPFAGDRPWHVAVDAKALSLDIRTAIVPGLRTLAGTLNAELRVDGSRLHPKGSGFLRVDHGGLAFAGSPFVYRNGSVNLALRDEAIDLRRLAFDAAEGHVELSGTGRLSGWRPVAFDGTATLRGAPLSFAGANGWLDARLDLHAERDTRGLESRVVIHQGKVRIASVSRIKPLQSTSTPSGLVFVDAAGRAHAALRAEAAKSHLPPDLLLDVSIPDPLEISGDEVATSLTGGLGIVVVDGQPRVRGAIAAGKGWLSLLGRKYQLKRLNVTFDGAAAIDPYLDLRITRATDVTIIIDVEGPASRPDVTFSSSPPRYSQEQIMAMILSGDPGTAGASDLALDDRVAGALSGTVVGKLKDQLLPVLPIDAIKINLQRDASGQEDTRLEVGKYLTEKVYVSYVHQLGTAVGLRRLNQNQLQVEYRFARHFELESLFGDNGVGAFDLYWNHRF